MVEVTQTVSGTWADGEVTARPGESIVFEGEVTGVDVGVKATFHADGDGVYRYEKGTAETPSLNQQTMNLIVKHVEMGLIDAGWRIDTKVAPDDYERAEG